MVLTDKNKEMLKKAVVIFLTSVTLIGLIFLLSNFIYHKTKPTNHDEQRYGTVTVRLAGWSSPSESLYVRWMNETLPELNRLGPTFTFVDHGENVTVYKADLVSSNAECATRPAIYFTHVTNQPLVRIDPVCVNGEFEFKAAFMHELGHAIGMAHICRLQETNSDCSVVGRGPAVMNPNIRYESDGDGDLLTTELGPQPSWEFSGLDLKEAQRALEARRR
jgi:hypothetical protein